VNFQVTVLKILVSYPDGFGVMEDHKARQGHPGDRWPRLGRPDEAFREQGAGFQKRV